MFNYIDAIPESVQDYCDSWFDFSDEETINSSDTADSVN